MQLTEFTVTSGIINKVSTIIVVICSEGFDYVRVDPNVLTVNGYILHSGLSMSRNSILPSCLVLTSPFGPNKPIFGALPLAIFKFGFDIFLTRLSPSSSALPC